MTTPMPTDFDTEDVPLVIAKTDTDGSGTTDLNGLPASDFVAFAESDVETEATA